MVAPDTAVILETPGHFEAVANTSGRQWSGVLEQLRTAPSEAEDQRSAAWQRHVIQDKQRIDIGTTGGNSVWTFGMQTRLSVHGLGAEAFPWMQARALAEAQATADDFWDALQSSVSIDLGCEMLEDGNELHRLGVSPWQGHQESLSRNDQGFVELPGGVRVDESPFQHVAEVRVRQGRVMGLTLQSSGEGDIAVEFDHPWARGLVGTGLTCSHVRR